MSQPMRHHTNTPRRGFTIIELLIATLLFTVIITIIGTAVVAISRIYYRGIVLTNTQNAARSILDATAQSLQFDAASSSTLSNRPPESVVGGGTGLGGSKPDEGELCVGNHIFKYQLYKKATSDAASHTFSSATSGATCQDSGPLTYSGQEYVSTNMRLSQLEITQIGSTNFWSVKVGVVYGDDDLLCISTDKSNGSTDCSSTTAVSDGSLLRSANLACKAQLGSQFCGVAQFSTIIQRRVE